MSHEILYTSAPHGLKPGSRGFCTVVSTTGLAKNLAERLESFSGYRHAFMAHEAQAGQNPVNFAHYHTTVGGRKFHILSRVADAGLDYTQRSNKLAHHVALEPAETVDAPGGPAWVMAAKDFFVQQWDGQVRTLPDGRQPTFADRPAQICRCWKQLTGDAGWGGVLAESALRKNGVMSVIFPAGTAVLELVVESLGLLPPERRWEVTFSTYFTKAPAGVDCQWRFLLDGTPEATALRRDVRATVIDLCNPLGQAQGGELVKAARTGVVSHREAVRSATPLTRATPDAPRPVSVAPSRVEVPEEPDELALAPPAPSFVRRPSAPPAWLPPEQPARRNRWLLPAVACGLLLAFLGIVLAAVLLSNRFDVPPVQVVETDVKPPDSPPLEPDDPEAAKQDNDLPKEEPEDSFEAAPPVAVTDSSDKPRPAEKKKSEPPPPPPDPFSSIRKGRLQLPPLTIMEDSGTFAKKQVNPEKRELARLRVKSSQDVQLELVGKEFEPRSGQTNTITHFDENGMRRWEVTAELKTTLQTSDLRKIATFELQDGVLRFNWEDWKTDRPPLRLAFCSLKLAAEGEVVTCALELPSKTVPSAELKIEPGARISLAQGAEFALRPDDDVVLDLKFRGIKGAEPTGRATIKQPKVNVSVPAPQYHPNVSDAKVTVELSLFHEQREGLWIEGKLSGMAASLSPTQQTKDAYWKSHNWNVGRANLELSDTAIKKHFDDTEYLFSQVKVVMQNQFKFKDLKNWLALSATTREVAVKEYAFLDEQVAMFLKEKSKKGLDLAQEKRYQERISELNDLRKKRPDVQLAYEKHGLDNPDIRDIATTYNKFASVFEEVRAWHDAMKQFKTDLHNQARLDYRLYVKVDDREIPLVVTEGFSDVPRKAKD